MMISLSSNIHRPAVLLAACALISMLPAAAPADDWGAFELVGRKVAAGQASRFAFIPDRSFEASYLNMPVFVARGTAPGPTLCLTAGVHGDELNGVEVARRAFAGVDPQTLRGTLVALPAINAEGVRTGNRYLSDRRDLNRAFPGSTRGSVASLIANAVFSKVLTHCDALVDLHTASNNRTNQPQIRADIANPAIRALAVHFGHGMVIAGEGPDGSLRREAAKAGVAAIIYEAGEPYRFQEDEIAHGVRGVRSVMAYLDMIDGEEITIPDDRVFEKSRWVRVPVQQGGFFFPDVALGATVQEGDHLGKVVDPLTDEAHEITSPVTGEVIGMSVSQPVLSGYALYHVAWHEQD